MPDCREAVLSNEYADFIMEYNVAPERIFEEYGDFCVQIMGVRYSAIYAKRAAIPDLSIKEYTYTAIPKLYGLMDTGAVEETGSLKLQNQPNLNLTGRNVIVGFIDTGINHAHKAFLDTYGKSRILRIWDQTNQEGTPPSGFYYGTEFTNEDIDLALAGNNPFKLVNSIDENGHGTFLAGVACGSVDEENDFAGAAPESKIVMVKLKPAKQYLRDFYYIKDDTEAYQENDIMLAVHYLDRISIQYGLPLVIIIGLGTNTGGHDGLSPLAGQLDYMAGNIGHSVVVCAGNEGNSQHHYRGNLFSSGMSLSDMLFEDVQFRTGENEKGFLMELWGHAPDIYAVSIHAPTGESIPRIAAGIGQSDKYTFLLNSTVIYIDYRVVEQQSGDELIAMRFENPTSGIWTVRVYGSNILNGIYDVWLPISEFTSEDTYFLQPNPDVTITMPGTAGNVIAVSSYNNSTDSFYSDSGRGFTRLNAIKPDIAAPGVNVFGPSLSGSRYTRRSGTSVSAALTGGVCAQLLQWGITDGNASEMRNNNIRSYLIRGARKNRNIVYPSREWGYGELDGYNTFVSLAR